MSELSLQNYLMRLVHPRLLLLDLELWIVNFSALDDTISLNFWGYHIKNEPSVRLFLEREIEILLFLYFVVAATDDKRCKWLMEIAALKRGLNLKAVFVLRCHL